MKLVSSLTTPFGRKIRILLEEKHLPYTLVEDIPWNADSKTPDFNPLGKVPVLVLDNGDTVFDSRVIAEYLDLRGTPHHIPVEPGARIRVKRWEALADGICDAAANIFIERKRAPAQQSEDWIKRQRGKIDAALREAERLLHGDWCEGEHFTLADAALVAALGYLKLRFASEIPLTPYPKLAAWFSRVEKRPSVASTVAPG
ncbi:MAG: glutathione S-transferase N-terminal domain-containing protein [Gammaproteobacteria bacterium]